MTPPRDPFNPLAKYDSLRTPSSRGGSAVGGLEWDEASAENQSQIEGFGDADRGNSLKWLYWLSLVVCVVLVLKLFSVQVVHGLNFSSLAQGNRIRTKVVLAPRGHVLDRNGETLVENTASFNLVATPIDLPKQGLEDEVKKVSDIFGLNAQDVLGAIQNNKRSVYDPLLIKQDLSQEQSILFQTRAGEFVGFSVETVPIRSYPEAEAFSHVLGYTGVVNDGELADLADQHYDENDFIGKSGIELSYEQYLRGTNGQRQIQVDAAGNQVKVLGTVDPEPGKDIKLTIDKDLQDQLYQNFKLNGTTSRGAAIALNPKTGEVLALLSMPGFDNNEFAHGITQDQYQALTDDKNLPLFDRAIGGTYPPGSTAKLMVAVAGLQEGVVTENTTIVDRGVLVIPNQFDANQTYNFYGWQRAGLGPMQIRSAIAQSSDIYFYTVAGGQTNTSVTGLGAEKLAEYYRKFHLGQVTGIDLQGEKPGLVPDPEWKDEFYKHDPILGKWYLGDTYHIGIGQGDLLVTPLQVAMWTAAIANNGVGYRPQLLKEVAGQDGKATDIPKPQIIIQNVADQKNIKIVQEGMRQTILSGSGSRLSTLPISAAGKTGTSQFDGSDPTRTHAWFTVYAPYEDPQIVITVLVEAGGEGHLTAESIVKPTLEWWAKNRYNK